MLKLNLDGINNEAWKKAGIATPLFNIEEMVKKTKEKPQWLHFGAGNIVRGFMAANHQRLLEDGKVDTGIVVAESYDYEIIDSVFKPYDNLSLLVTLRADGKFEQEMIASVADGLVGDINNKEDWEKLEQIFENPSLQMVSFTITEKGYMLKNINGEYLNIVKRDIEDAMKSPIHAISKIVFLMNKRYLAGKYPLALVSMDNCSKNGEKLQSSVIDIAKAWEQKGVVDSGFIKYLSDENTVSYPWTMIDKITPRPAKEVQDYLAEQGIEDMKTFITEKNTYIAPFVNAELCQYLIIEDKFPNGRPPLDETRGITFTDRDTVNKIETMKVTTCLNPLHTALAVLGCLLGYTLIADEMKDKELSKLVALIGYKEGLPVVVEQNVLDPKEFIDEVIQQRLSNPFIPDTPQRIATDTSMKVGIRFGETIKAYVRDDLDIEVLTGIPIAIAGWLRYLLAVDDEGNAFEPSSDPMLEELTAMLKDVKLGDSNVSLKSILKNEKLFGIDLFEAGIGEKIQMLFNEMIQGKGSVRSVLVKYL